MTVFGACFGYSACSVDVFCNKESPLFIQLKHTCQFCNTERPSFQLEIQIEIVQQIKLKMFNIQTSEIEQFFFIKLIEAKGEVKGGICTITEMTVILHGDFELVLKFCDKLKHELSLAILRLMRTIRLSWLNCRPSV